MINVFFHCPQTDLVVDWDNDDDESAIVKVRYGLKPEREVTAAEIFVGQFDSRDQKQPAKPPGIGTVLVGNFRWRRAGKPVRAVPLLNARRDACAAVMAPFERSQGEPARIALAPRFPTLAGYRFRAP